MALAKDITSLTLSDRAYLLAISSLRPVQLLMSIAGAFVIVGLTIAPMAGTPTPLDRLMAMITEIPVYTALIVYVITSVIAALAIHKTTRSERICGTASILGTIIWSFCFASSMKTVDGEILIVNAISFLYSVPMFADMWILAQLLSGVRSSTQPAQYPPNR